MRRKTSGARVAAWIVAVIASGPVAGAAAEDDGPERRAVVAVAAVSDDFVERTRFACRSIPQHVWSRVEQAGWRVWVAPTVVDAMPHLRGQRPRGWPDGTTWENSDAVHFPKKQLLVMAESRRTADGRPVACHRIDGVLRHEFGHAFDLAAGIGGSAASAGAAFRRAYRDDVARMNADRRERLRYYLQPGDSGPQEAFAEAFAITLGGGSDELHQDAFRDAFPGVMEFVAAQIGRRKT